jgi:hypothetical protein
MPKGRTPAKSAAEKDAKSLKKHKPRQRKGLVFTDTGNVMVVKVLKLESMEHNLSRVLIQAEVENIMPGASQVEIQYILNEFLQDKEEAIDLSQIRQDAKIIEKGIPSQDLSK